MVEHPESVRVARIIVFGGIGLLVVLFAAIWFSYSGFYQFIYNEYSISKEHADIKHKFKSKCDGVSTVPELRNCFKEQIENSGEIRRAEENLYAQKEIVGWAKWSFFTGILTTIVTALGVWFVKRTLDETRKATEAAILTGKAAQDSVEVTREIGQKQVRAYISAVKANFSIYDGSIYINVFIKNAGQSPASNVKICFNGIYWAVRNSVTEELISSHRFFFDQNIFFSFTDISSENEEKCFFFLNNENIGFEIISAIHQQCTVFGIFCTLHWDDVFGQSHELNISTHTQKIKRDGIISGEMNIDNKSDYKKYLKGLNNSPLASALQNYVAPDK